MILQIVNCNSKVENFLNKNFLFKFSNTPHSFEPMLTNTAFNLAKGTSIIENYSFFDFTSFNLSYCIQKLKPFIFFVFCNTEDKEFDNKILNKIKKEEVKFIELNINDKDSINKFTEKFKKYSKNEDH